MLGLIRPTQRTPEAQEIESNDRQYEWDSFVEANRVITIDFDENSGCEAAIFSKIGELILTSL